MAPRTSDHQHFWKLWTVQLNAVSAGLSTMVGAAVLADLPEWVSVGLAAVLLVVNGLAMYTRTITQAKLVEKSNAGEVPQNEAQSP